MLVIAIARGDRDALASLYDRFAGTLLAVGHRILGPSREVEDLLHDVFLEVWHHAGEYSPQRGSVRSWLLVRMRSRSLDRLRSARIARAAVDEVQATAPLETHTADSPHHRALHQRLREALATLPEDQQQVLALNYFEGLSAAEIGSRLGIPVGTIKSRMLRAMSRLRAILGEGQS
jgi:RNA polymerase sigma-70 factor (ECF subfamily)